MNDITKNYIAGDEMSPELKNFEATVESNGTVSNGTAFVVVTPEVKEAPKADGGGLRYDTGKNRLDLIPPEWTWALGMVLTKGAIKYETRNWEKGMDWSKVIGPMKRHLEKFLAGERYDEETGCHHLSQVAWNALALMSYDLREIGKDDRAGDISLLNKVTGSNQKQEKENNE